MKKISITTLQLVVVTLLIFSCKQEITPPVVLELADYATIDFPTEGGSREVAIKTNQATWTAVAQDAWLEVDQQNNKVILKASPNAALDVRKTSVLFTAGGVTQRLDVTQAASKSTLSIASKDLIDEAGSMKLKSNQFGGQKEIKVLTVDPAWTFEVINATWVKAQKSPLESSLLLTLEENKSREARSAVIFVRTKDESMKFNIVQEGTLYYILPLLIPESSKENVKDFEEARQSRVVKNASYLSGGAHTYHTVSPLFYEIKYSFDRRNLREVIMQCEKAEELLADGFTKLLTAEGFEYVGDSGMERVFIKKIVHNGTSYEIFANLLYGTPKTDPQAVFNILKRQQKPMPTFEKLPDGIGRFDVTHQAVIAWESTHGGMYSTRNSNPETGYHFFDVLDKTYIARDYLFQNGKLMNMRIFTYDVSKFFYSPAKGTFKMTDEFKALLKKEGFTETRATGDEWERFYINRQRKMAVSARVTSFATVLSGQPLVIMLYLPFDESES